MENTQSRWRIGLSPNVLLLGAVSFLNDSASEMIYPLLPAFLTSVLGAGPAALGIVEGIAESTASFLKLASGFISDRVHRRKNWVVGGYLLSNAARPLIGLAGSWPAVLILRFFDRIGKGLRTSPRDALIAESTPPDYRGKAFGFHRAADHAGAVAGPLLATLFLDVFILNLKTVFLLSVIPGLITIAVLFVGVREIPASKASERGRLHPALPDEGATRAPLMEARPPARPEPLRIRQAWLEMPGTLRQFVLILFLFTLGNSTDAFLLLKAQQLGVTVGLLPVLWVVLHIVKMTSSVPGGVASDRWGRKRVIVAGWIVYALTYAGFMIADSVWEAWTLFAVYGLYFGLTEGVEKALISDLAPTHLRGSAFGLYNLMIGIGALPASLLFGWVWQSYGSAPAFGMGAAFALAATLWLWRLPVRR